MRQSWIRNTLTTLLAIFFALAAEAADMRALQVEALQMKDELSRKAHAEKVAAQQAAAESHARITEDRHSLQQEIARLSDLYDTLASSVDTLEKSNADLTEQENALGARLEKVDGTVRELVGIMRINAKDLGDLIEASGQTQLAYDRYASLATIAENAKFPSMEEVRRLHSAVLEQIEMTGEVTLQPGKIIDRAGLAAAADLLFVGPFTVLYRTSDETGFLNYAYAGNKLYALSHLPPHRMQSDIADYMDGGRDSIMVDISRGAALRQLSYQKSLLDQITGGGPIVWPILAILIVGLLIVLERMITLARKHHRYSPVYASMTNLIQENDWSGCEQVCRKYADKPIARVLMAGVHSHAMVREDMENVLQEAILREVPVLERFLSTLGMLVAIAPLLGLLGTVTGMINVFHVITLSGTGDPRLMSGGISEALVTTMLGLGVAIPLMLLHNVLNGTVDRMVAEMEEKSVALVNLIHKQREPA